MVLVIYSCCTVTLCTGSPTRVHRGLLEEDINGNMGWILHHSLCLFLSFTCIAVSVFCSLSCNASLCLQAFQSLPLDCPCHMGLWPHTLLGVFVAERDLQSLTKNNKKYSAYTFPVPMLRQHFLLFPFQRYAPRNSDRHKEAFLLS